MSKSKILYKFRGEYLVKGSYKTVSPPHGGGETSLTRLLLCNFHFCSFIAIIFYSEPSRVFMISFAIII